MAHFDKKTDRIEIRVSPNEKSEFSTACDLQGDTPSSALRRFMTGYIRRKNADTLSSAFRAYLVSSKPSQRLVASFAVFVIAVGLGGLAIGLKANAHEDRRADRETFKLLDRNGSGSVTAEEIGNESEWFILALDRNEDGQVDSQEFRSRFGYSVIYQNVSNDGPFEDKCVMGFFDSLRLDGLPSERKISGVAAAPLPAMIRNNRTELCSDGMIHIDAQTGQILSRSN